jgi:oligoendopeptidase F
MSKIIDKNLKIDAKYTSDLGSVFSSVLACENQLNLMIENIEGLALLPANPTNCASDLLEWLKESNRIAIDTRKIYIYALLSHQSNLNDPQYAALSSNAIELFQRYQTAILPLEESLTRLSQEKWQSFAKEVPELLGWKHYYHDFHRREKHIASTEVEVLLSDLQVSITHASRMNDRLIRAMYFNPVLDSSGHQQELSRSNFVALRSHKDPIIRLNTNRNYQNSLYRHRETTTDTLYQYMRLKMLEAKARKYSSNLEMVFDDANVDQSIFFQTLEACENRSAIWDRFWITKQKALGLESLSTNDVPFNSYSAASEVSYEQAVEWIVESVKPLGTEYANQLRSGLTTDHWVDVYPREGKSTTEYFATTQGCKPFIMLNYKKDFLSLSTLAHESGHSMHCFYTSEAQPHHYSFFGMTVAETAANVHQALLFSFLRNNNVASDIQLAALETEMRVSRHYLMQMPLNARFEHELYSKLWNGEGFEADSICARYLELSKAIKGSALTFVESDAVDWMNEPVLWQHYYALKYTFGIAGAQAIAERLLSNEPGAVEGYHQLLRAGCSLDEFEILAMAGVKFDNSSTIDKAFQRVERLVGELDALV